MRRKHVAWFSLLLLVGLVSVPINLTWRQVRQEQRDHQLIAAIARNDTSTIRSLLKQGADPNAPIVADETRSGWQLLWDRLRHWSTPQRITNESALMKAVEWLPDENTDIANITTWDNSDTIQALVEAGANVNFHGGTTFSGGVGPRLVNGEWQTTPLIAAGVLGKYATVKILLANHADVNAVDAADTTVLMVAAGDGNVGLVKALLKNGANVNARDTDGRTALFWALQPDVGAFSLGFAKVKAATEVQAIAAHLLRAGAIVNIQDNEGTTPIYLAREVWHDPKLISLLRKAGAK